MICYSIDFALWPICIDTGLLYHVTISKQYQLYCTIVLHSIVTLNTFVSWLLENNDKHKTLIWNCKVLKLVFYSVWKKKPDFSERYTYTSSAIWRMSIKFTVTHRCAGATAIRMGAPAGFLSAILWANPNFRSLVKTI